MPLAAGLALAGCSGSDDAGSTTAFEGTSAPEGIASDAVTGAPSTGPLDQAGTPAGSMSLGDEEVAIGSLLCYFEEQPRAGPGGVFTHTAQGRGANADGQPVVLDLSRTRDEDGTVEDQIIVDIGDPTSDDAFSLSALGSEGLIQFGDASAAASDVEVSDFASGPVTLSFDLTCG